MGKNRSKNKNNNKSSKQSNPPAPQQVTIPPLDIPHPQLTSKDIIYAIAQNYTADQAHYIANVHRQCDSVVSKLANHESSPLVRSAFYQPFVHRFLAHVPKHQFNDVLCYYASKHPRPIRRSTSLQEEWFQYLNDRRQMPECVNCPQCIHDRNAVAEYFPNLTFESRALNYESLMVDDFESNLWVHLDARVRDQKLMKEAKENIIASIYPKQVDPPPEPTLNKDVPKFNDSVRKQFAEHLSTTILRPHSFDQPSPRSKRLLTDREYSYVAQYYTHPAFSMLEPASQMDMSVDLSSFSMEGDEGKELDFGNGSDPWSLHSTEIAVLASAGEASDRLHSQPSLDGLDIDPNLLLKLASDLTDNHAQQFLSTFQAIKQKQKDAPNIESLDNNDASPNSTSLTSLPSLNMSTAQNASSVHRCDRPDDEFLGMDDMWLDSGYANGPLEDMGMPWEDLYGPTGLFETPNTDASDPSADKPENGFKGSDLLAYMLQHMEKLDIVDATTAEIDQCIESNCYEPIGPNPIFRSLVGKQLMESQMVDGQVIANRIVNIADEAGSKSVIPHRPFKPTQPNPIPKPNKLNRRAKRQASGCPHCCGRTHNSCIDPDDWDYEDEYTVDECNEPMHETQPGKLCVRHKADLYGITMGNIMGQEGVRVGAFESTVQLKGPNKSPWSAFGTIAAEMMARAVVSMMKEDIASQKAMELIEEMEAEEHRKLESKKRKAEQLAAKREQRRIEREAEEKRVRDLQDAEDRNKQQMIEQEASQKQKLMADQANVEAERQQSKEVKDQVKIDRVQTQASAHVVPIHATTKGSKSGHATPKLPLAKSASLAVKPARPKQQPLVVPPVSKSTAEKRVRSTSNTHSETIVPARKQELCLPPPTKSNTANGIEVQSNVRARKPSKTDLSKTEIVIETNPGSSSSNAMPKHITPALQKPAAPSVSTNLNVKRAKSTNTTTAFQDSSTFVVHKLPPSVPTGPANLMNGTAAPNQLIIPLGVDLPPGSKSSLVPRERPSSPLGPVCSTPSSVPPATCLDNNSGHFNLTKQPVHHHQHMVMHPANGVHPASIGPPSNPMMYHYAPSHHLPPNMMMQQMYPQSMPGNVHQQFMYGPPAPQFMANMPVHPMTHPVPLPQVVMNPSDTLANYTVSVPNNLPASQPIPPSAYSGVSLGFEPSLHPPSHSDISTMHSPLRVNRQVELDLSPSVQMTTTTSMAPSSLTTVSNSKAGPTEFSGTRPYPLQLNSGLCELSQYKSSAIMSSSSIWSPFGSSDPFNELRSPSCTETVAPASTRHATFPALPVPHLASANTAFHWGHPLTLSIPKQATQLPDSGIMSGFAKDLDVDDALFNPVLGSKPFDLDTVSASGELLGVSEVSTYCGLSRGTAIQCPPALHAPGVIGSTGC